MNMTTLADLDMQEFLYVHEVIQEGGLASDGHFTQRCARLLESQFQIPQVLMTPSCTSALEIAARLCGLGPGDEVIVPSFAFPSTANAIVLTGAHPVFVDIRPDTLNIDEQEVEEAITSRTKAIFVVHYGGIACEMNRLAQTAVRHGLMLVEDAAQSVNSKYEDRFLGSLGHLGTYSFHHTKNFICGEGGALCINDIDLVERAEILREKGTNRSAFLRNQTDKYTWIDMGTSSVPSELCCAFLLAQLQKMQEITMDRKSVFDSYMDGLLSLAAENRLRFPLIPESCTSNYHLFPILLNTENDRQGLMKHLQANNVAASFHFLPLHSSPMGRKLGYDPNSLPRTNELSRRLLRLPLSHTMDREEVGRIVSLVYRFFSDS